MTIGIDLSMGCSIAMVEYSVQPATSNQQPPKRARRISLPIFQTTKFLGEIRPGNVHSMLTRVVCVLCCFTTLTTTRQARCCQQDKRGEEKEWNTCVDAWTITRHKNHNMNRLQQRLAQNCLSHERFRVAHSSRLAGSCGAVIGEPSECGWERARNRGDVDSRCVCRCVSFYWHKA